MNRSSLVDQLRAAIASADPNWPAQPSRLRRALTDELGSDAKRHRAQVHQLVVAAEENVPARLQRIGWSAAAHDELAHLLVVTRGWTSEAASWTVKSWAAALGLSDERPVVPDTTPASDTVTSTESNTLTATSSDSTAATELPPSFGPAEAER